MKIYFKQAVAFCFIAALMSCGGKMHAPPKLVSLPELPQDYRPLVNESAPRMDEERGYFAQMSPCEYWDFLRTQHPSKFKQVFKIFENLELVASEKTNKELGDFVIYARVNLLQAPQFRFAMSAEFNKSKKSIDPPTLEEFLKMAKIARSNGELSWLEYNYLMMLENFGMRKKLIELRNEALIAKTEKELPGVFTGVGGPLRHESLILSDLESYVESDLSQSHTFESTKPLTQPVPLYLSDDWGERRLDLKNSLRLMARDYGLYSDENPSNLNERVCQYALNQRVLAQVLNIKGVRGIPKIKSNGLLVAVPTREFEIFPEENLSGDYGVPLTEELVKKQLKNPDIRAKNADTFALLVENMRFFVELTANRSSKLWLTPGEVKEPGSLNNHSRILRLGFGLFGVGASFLRQDIDTKVPGHVFLNDDTEDNFVSLLMLSLEVVKNYSSLVNPSALEKSVLSEEELTSFTAPYPLGAVQTFEKLIQGLVLEGLDRIQKDPSHSLKIKKTLKIVGESLNNEYLKSL